MQMSKKKKKKKVTCSFQRRFTDIHQLPMAPRSTGSITQDFLHRTISGIFEQAQFSLTNHRKNCIILHELHLRVAEISQISGRVSDPLKFTGEQWFGDVFLDMVNRVLTVRKGPTVADRIVKFVGTYVRFMNEKGELTSSSNNCIIPLVLTTRAAVEQLLVTSNLQVALTSARRAADDDQTTASRFSARLLKWLIRGFSSKNKIVRYRTVAIICETISHLGEIE